MKEEILTRIKQLIISRLVNSSVPFRGQNKKVLRFIEWWANGFEFVPDFDIASIPISGPVQTNLRFHVWVIIDIDGNQGRRVGVGANFGPLTISFNGTAYQIDDSVATFDRMSVS